MIRSTDGWKLPKALTPLQKQRIADMRELAAQKSTQVGAARSLGICTGHLSDVLFRLTGSCSWPPEFDPALDSLPLRAEAKPRPLQDGRAAEALSCALRAWMAEHPAWPIKRISVCVSIGQDRLIALLDNNAPIQRETANRLRQFLKRPDPDDHNGEAIERMRVEAEEARRAHEQGWLQEERAKYGLPRSGRPLSRMPI